MEKKQEFDGEKNVERAQSANSLKLRAYQNASHSKWASPISGTLSDDALRIEQEEQEKQTRLGQRRNHLTTILETEKNKYQTELISHRQSSRESTSTMKTYTDSLGSTRVNDHRIINDDELQQHSGTNNTNSCAIELQELENLPEQFNGKCSLEEEEEEEEQDGQSERIRRSRQLKVILQQQMDEFNLKDQKLETLQQDEEYLLREQCQLDQFEEERKHMEKPLIQQERQLLRQHKAKLHKRAKEIQEQLEADIKILKLIIHTDAENRFEQSLQRERLKQSTLNILKQFQQQTKLEKEKEQEFDAMYQDEAAKQWSYREQGWNQERESREKLMQQMIQERHEQIQKELQAIQEQRKEIYERQRTLIDDMEQARKYDLIEKQKQAKEKEEKKQDSHRQMLIIQQEREKFRLELEKQDAIEREDNKQKTPTNAATVEPKFYGRRRINWN